ncbi:MAG: TonB-dependent receptor [SAR86 cluster bacterium]|uniref:TonB-dependent receptor n=1 Tax=SAR86 cluster bacterium TaxID=2030880 RepID=A0A937ICA6_9GAMM|nr:TonB-dependent receptor [SAR86 cluster bacterium]
MKKFFIGLVLIPFVFFSQEDIEEVVVQSSILDQTSNELEDPLHIVSGEGVENDGTRSLGEALDNLLGVASSDYGFGVGQPIIRGLSGSRVKILNNGMVVRDVSALGGDHINEVDLYNIQQIEIVRGPSSLLYTNGAIGGLINIVDNTIAQEDFDKLSLGLSSESQSVNDGSSIGLNFSGNFAGFNVSAAFKDSDFANYDVPDGAIMHMEEEHEEEEHEEEHEEDLSFLANSDYGSTSARFGLSKTGDWGYVGLSFNNLESSYGIPFHGEGHEGHDEHEEDHDEDHEGEEHEEEYDEHEDERIFSTTESNVVNLEGSLNLNASLIRKVNYFLRDTDYSLTEQHAEEDHEGEEHEGEMLDVHDHAEGPTLFKNDALEYGAIFDLSTNDFSRKISVNLAEEEVSIFGEEAYMLPVSSSEANFGLYLGKDMGFGHVDFGIRYDLIDREGSIVEHHEDELEEHEGEEHEYEQEEHIEFFNPDFSALSFAGGIDFDLNENLSLSLNFASVARAPSAVELFINGPHLATSRYEVGDVNLEEERSNNTDLSLSWARGEFFADLSYFSNAVDNYIYLQDESEEEHEEHEDEEHEGEEHHDHGGLILSNYMQKDADFYGYEFEVGRNVVLPNGNFIFTYAMDSVTAEFSNGGGFVPRIVPKRNIVTAIYESNNGFSGAISFKDVKTQKDIDEYETPTKGYQMLDARLTKSYDLGKLFAGSNSKLNVSLFGNNLLDEVARNHSSFVKDEVPLPGKNIGIKFSLKF